MAYHHQFDGYELTWLLFAMDMGKSVVAAVIDNPFLNINKRKDLRVWRRNDGEEKGSLRGRREKRVGGDERRS